MQTDKIGPRPWPVPAGRPYGRGVSLDPNPAAPAPTAGLPVLSPGALETLAADLGEVSEVVELVEEFLAALPDRLTQVTTSSDPVEARRAAHTVKSTSALLGLTSLSSLCAELERQVAEGPLRPEQHLDLHEQASTARAALVTWCHARSRDVRGATTVRPTGGPGLVGTLQERSGDAAGTSATLGA